MFKKNILLQKSAIYPVTIESKNEHKLFFQPNNSGASSLVNKTARQYDKDEEYGANIPTKLILN